MAIKCFLVKASSWCTLYARRLVLSADSRCCEKWYHNASARVGLRPISEKKIGDSLCWSLDDQYKIPRDSSLWPTKCDRCDYIFTENDYYDNEFHVMYVRVDSFEEDVSDIIISSDGITPYQERVIGIARTWWQKDKLPAGAMWRADWMRGHFWDNETEDPLYVMLPDGIDWNIDSRANNCTLPQDRTHRCWVRTGFPPVISAGKGGYTCTAGAGSISTGNFHGFLTNGELTSLPDSKIQI